jgi:ABC-type transport system involved in cytochrome bd biosynthesis fused ATPase/permease subunit
VEKSIEILLTGQYTVESLLMAIILLFVTKRIVPWWVYEQLEKEYKEMKAKAESMSDTVDDYVRGYKDALHHVNNNRRRNLKSAGGYRSATNPSSTEGVDGPCEGRNHVD